MSLRNDWGEWLVGLPGRGPGIQYQVLLGTMGLAPMALEGMGRFVGGFGEGKLTGVPQQVWISIGAHKGPGIGLVDRRGELLRGVLRLRRPFVLFTRCLSQVLLVVVVLLLLLLLLIR
jgi:hypothetical protein